MSSSIGAGSPACRAGFVDMTWQVAQAQRLPFGLDAGMPCFIAVP
jgi:hypothetical protein